MASFDPQAFLDSSVTESNDTVVIPCPIGEYTGIVDKLLPRTWQSKDGTQSGVAIDVLWLIEDNDVKAFLGRDTVIVKQGIMLDTLSSGALDMSKGKNVPLGRLREALEMNSPGQPFAFSMIPGRAGKVSVTHRLANEDTFAEIRSVAKL